MMNNLIDLIKVKNLFFLLISPPASGKTSFLLKIFELSDLKFVFLSPLRALANEFYERIKEQFDSCLVKSISDEIDFNKKIIVITPELLKDDLIFEDRIFVLDEFHLYYIWGNSFRNVLVEKFYEIANNEKTVLGLSATIDNSLFNLIKQEIPLGFNHSYIFDAGNLKLKHFPQKIVWHLKKDKMEKYLKKTDKTVLYFCKYRKEVDYLVEKYSKKGFEVLGCKGGEVNIFSERLKDTKPDFIFATTCLGHGVNLPELSHIFISYKVSDLTFYIQMVGRGGRKGESFILHTYDSYLVSTIQKIKSIILNLIWNLTIQKLKELSFLKLYIETRI